MLKSILIVFALSVAISSGAVAAEKRASAAKAYAYTGPWAAAAFVPSAPCTRGVWNPYGKFCDSYD